MTGTTSTSKLQVYIAGLLKISMPRAELTPENIAIEEVGYPPVTHITLDIGFTSLGKGGVKGSWEMFCGALDNAVVPRGGVTLCQSAEGGTKTLIKVHETLETLRNLSAEEKLTFAQTVGKAPGQKILGPEEYVGSHKPAKRGGRKQ